LCVKSFKELISAYSSIRYRAGMSEALRKLLIAKSSIEQTDRQIDRVVGYVLSPS
jgi:hypothetical protein